VILWFTKLVCMALLLNPNTYQGYFFNQVFKGEKKTVTIAQIAAQLNTDVVDYPANENVPLIETSVGLTPRLRDIDIGIVLQQILTGNFSGLGSCKEVADSLLGFLRGNVYLTPQYKLFPAGMRGRPVRGTFVEDTDDRVVRFLFGTYLICSGFDCGVSRYGIDDIRTMCSRVIGLAFNIGGFGALRTRILGGSTVSGIPIPISVPILPTAMATEPFNVLRALFEPAYCTEEHLMAYFHILLSDLCLSVGQVTNTYVLNRDETVHLGDVIGYLPDDHVVDGEADERVLRQTLFPMRYDWSMIRLCLIGLFLEAAKGVELSCVVNAFRYVDNEKVLVEPGLLSVQRDNFIRIFSYPIPVLDDEAVAE